MMHYASYSFDTCSHGKFHFFFGGDSEFEKDMHCLGVLSCFNFQPFNKLPLQQLVGQKRRWAVLATDQQNPPMTEASGHHIHVGIDGLRSRAPENGGLWKKEIPIP